MSIYLPHTLNSTAGANAYEPFVGSQFQLFFTPPSGVSSAQILREHVKSVTGMFGDQSGEEAIEQQYQNATRSYDSNNKQTFYDITVNFTLNLDDNNDLYVYRILREWAHKKFNPFTGERGLKKDYIGSLTAIRYNRDGSIFWQRTASQAFIKSSFPDMPADYSAHEPLELELVFRADYVTDLTQ